MAFIKEPRRLRTVAIGDNHPLFRLAVTAILRDMESGCSVHEAEDFEDLCELLGTGTFDLVVADLGMPGCSRRALEEIVTAARGAPVVVFSSRTDAHEAKAFLHNGLQGYLPKTMSSAAVRIALKRVLSGESFLPAELETAPLLRKTEVPSLTLRQLQVLRGVSTGGSMVQIARDLGISEATVKLHLRGAIRAMRAKNRTDAVLAAERRGLFRDLPT
jgi:two-component system, NarL family, nitrate/nitrite response regulator NarL